MASKTKKKGPRKKRISLIFKNLLIAIRSALAILLLFYVLFIHPTYASQIQVEENANSIVELEEDLGEAKVDVGDLGEDINELSNGFDEFMYKNLEMMLEMRGLLNNIAKDESGNIALSNIGNAETDSGASANSEVVVGKYERK